jgi:hypothetical protein
MPMFTLHVVSDWLWTSIWWVYFDGSSTMVAEGLTDEMLPILGKVLVLYGGAE